MSDGARASADAGARRRHRRRLGGLRRRRHAGRAQAFPSRCSSRRRRSAAARGASPSAALALDNGQHLLIGAYDQTRELIALVHGADRADALFRRLPLTLRPFGSIASRAVSLAAWRAARAASISPAASLCARGLDVAERLALIADFRRLARGRLPLSERADRRRMLRRQRPAAHSTQSGTPLCLVGAQHAAAQRRRRRSSPMCCARPSPAPRATATSSSPRSTSPPAFRRPRRDSSRSTTARCAWGPPCARVRTDEKAVTVDVGASAEAFSAAIVAVGPHQLAATLGPDARLDSAWRAPLAQVAAFTYESITTIYLALSGRVPFAVPMLRLDDAPGQWAFDRSAALASDPAARRGKPDRGGHQRAAGRTMRSITRRSAATPKRSCGAAHPSFRPSSGRRSSSRSARRMRARRRFPALRTGASPAASISPAITPIPSFPPRSRRRLAAASRRLARCSRIAASRRAERAVAGIAAQRRQLPRRDQPPRAARAVPVRLRISRCCSRFHSRSLIVARLSYCFLPLARPTSSLIRPLAKWKLSGTSV